jgi:fibronectin type 3 domain-containing protein
LNNGVVLLDWLPVDTPDLAGYIVLRTDGTNDTLQPLTREPIAENTYEDKNVQPGMTYTYAVAAVDKATPPNRSQPSEKQVVIVR